MSYNRLIAELSHSVPYHLDLHTLLVTQRSSGCKRLDHNLQHVYSRSWDLTLRIANPNAR